MGYIAHDATVVTTSSFRPGGLPDMDAFRAGMPEPFRPLVVGPVKATSNGYVSYVFLPDGSKEGWPESRTGDKWRARFKELFLLGDGWDDVVTVRFGGDHASEIGDRVTSSSLRSRRQHMG